MSDAQATSTAIPLSTLQSPSQAAASTASGVRHSDITSNVLSASHRPGPITAADAGQAPGQDPATLQLHTSSGGSQGHLPTASPASLIASSKTESKGLSLAAWLGVAFAAGALVIAWYYGVKMWRLAVWTSIIDFHEACLEDQAMGLSSKACDATLAEAVRSPPVVVRSLLPKSRVQPAEYWSTAEYWNNSVTVGATGLFMSTMVLVSVALGAAGEHRRTALLAKCGTACLLLATPIPTLLYAPEYARLAHGVAALFICVTWGLPALVDLPAALVALWPRRRTGARREPVVSLVSSEVIASDHALNAAIIQGSPASGGPPCKRLGCPYHRAGAADQNSEKGSRLHVAGTVDGEDQPEYPTAQTLLGFVASSVYTKQQPGYSLKDLSEWMMGEAYSDDMVAWQLVQTVVKRFQLEQQAAESWLKEALRIAKSSGAQLAWHQYLEVDCGDHLAAQELADRQLQAVVDDYSELKAYFEEIPEGDEIMRRDCDEKIEALDHDHQDAVQYLRKRKGY